MPYVIYNGVLYHADNELYHYGVKGMKWGHRKARFIQGGSRTKRNIFTANTRFGSSVRNSNMTRRSSITQNPNTSLEERSAARKAKMKKAVKIGAAVAGTALAAYGAYKVSKAIKDKAFRVTYNRGVQAAARHVSSYDRTNIEAVRRHNDLVRQLSEANYDYAKRSSRTTAAAIRTLRGKNTELPPAEVMGMLENSQRMRANIPRASIPRRRR